jgi:signal transduction histidine kinase
MADSGASVAELQEEISRLHERVREAESRAEIAVPAGVRLPRSWRHRSTPAIRYAAAVLLVCAALLITVALKDSLHAAYFQTPFFFCAIVLSSWLGGFGSGICSTVLSILLIEYFFAQPAYSLGFLTNDIPRFAVFLFAGGFISWLGGRQRRDEEALLRAREELEEKVRARTADLEIANEKLKAEVAERVRQKARAEARTASVMRANETIPASLSNLGDTHGLGGLLGEVLSVIVEYLGEEGGGVWLYDAERDRLRLHVVFEDGEIKPAHESDHPDTALSDEQALAIEQGHGGSSLLHLFKNNVAAIFRSEAIATLPYLAPYRDYFTRKRTRSLLCIPLLAADELLGLISVRCRRNNNPSADEIAFVQAIAIHASLALKMSDLAEIERQAVVAEERNRMATDVHDTLAQAFAATLLHLRSMEMTDVSTEVQSHWKFAQDTSSEGLAAARRAMNAIRTAAPADTRPLAERLADRVQQIAARAGADTKVRFQLQGEATALPWAVEDELERLASEALFNAERHAAAGEISIKLDYSSGKGLRLRVRDDGRGFDQARSAGAGLGLRSMHDRAERIGASFTLITENDRGTEIVVLWMRDPENQS